MPFAQLLANLTSRQPSAGLRYDPLGRLYEITNGSGDITRLLYDGDALVGEFNTSGTMLSRNVKALSAGDDPMIRYAGSNAGRIHRVRRAG